MYQVVQSYVSAEMRLLEVVHLDAQDRCRAYVRAYVRVCACVWVCVRARACVHVCLGLHDG